MNQIKSNALEAHWNSLQTRGHTGMKKAPTGTDNLRPLSLARHVALQQLHHLRHPPDRLPPAAPAQRGPSYRSPYRSPYGTPWA